MVEVEVEVDGQHTSTVLCEASPCVRAILSRREVLAITSPSPRNHRHKMSYPRAHIRETGVFCARGYGRRCNYVSHPHSCCIRRTPVANLWPPNKAHTSSQYDPRTITGCHCKIGVFASFWGNRSARCGTSDTPCFAALPAQAVRLGCDHRPDWVSPLLCPPQPSFTKLYRLDLVDSSAPPSLVARFLQMHMATAPLRAFRVKLIRYHDRSELWESPVVMLQSLVAGSCAGTLTTFALCGRRIPHEASSHWSLTPDDIQPLYVCRGLKAFTIDFDCFLEEFSNSTLEAMADAWPHLEKLELIPICPDGDMDFTLRGLLLLARGCRDLTTFRGVFLQRDFLGDAQDFQVVIQSRLSTLDVGRTRLLIKDVRKVVTILEESFPNLVSVEDAFNLVPVSNARRKAWNMVRELLAEGRGMHKSV